MASPNGVHHLAIATRDVKAQLDFFTDVVGMELVALYWMHGVENTVHAFVKMGETSTIAFVQAPEMKDIEPKLGVSHAGFIAGNVAPGVMQHLALNVDSEADLMAMRDRVRSKGHWVMGPADHGFCKSIYLAAPEGIMLEFSTWTGLDTDEWIDPEVVSHCDMTAADIATIAAHCARPNRRRTDRISPCPPGRGDCDAAERTERQRPPQSEGQQSESYSSSLLTNR